MGRSQLVLQPAFAMPGRLDTFRTFSGGRQGARRSAKRCKASAYDAFRFVVPCTATSNTTGIELSLHALEGDRSRLATFLGCVGGGDRSKLRALNDRNLSEIKPPGTKPSLQRRSKSPLTIPCETRTAVCSIAFWCKVFLHRTSRRIPGKDRYRESSGPP